MLTYVLRNDVIMMSFTYNDVPLGATFGSVSQEIVVNLKGCQVKQIQVVLHGVASIETITQPNDT